MELHLFGVGAPGVVGLLSELIARTAPLAKVLLGSDFPIYKGMYGSVRFREEALVAAGPHLDAIPTLHDNAFRLFGSTEL